MHDDGRSPRTALTEVRSRSSAKNLVRSTTHRFTADEGFEEGLPYPRRIRDPSSSQRDSIGAASARSENVGTSGDSTSFPNVLRMPDISRAVTHIETNIRKSLVAAKKSLVSAGKSMSCVNVVPDPEGAPKDYQAGVGNNDESASDEGGTPILSRMPTTTLYEKAQRMMESIELKDRQYHLKTYKNCFVGMDAVDWMVKEGLADSAESAVELGNRMREQGFFKHVTSGHDFENKELFYHFTEMILDSGELCPTLPQLSREVVRIDRRVADLLSQVKLHRSLNVALFEQASEQQQKLEGHAQVLSHRVVSLENSLAIQMLVLGLILLVFMNGFVGYILKAAGMYLIWRGATTVHRALLEDDDSVDISGENATSCALLDQLRDAGGGSDGVEATSAPDEPKAGGKGEASSSLKQAKVSISPPTLEDYMGWPDRPCLLRLNKSVAYQHCLNGCDPDRIRINTGEPFFFETDIFKGCAALYVAGLESAPPGLFQGRKRKTHLVVQGQFKRQMNFSEVLTGQEFDRKLLHIPAVPVLNLLLRMARKMSPSMNAGIDPRPYLLSPVAAGAQIINCSKPGTEPSLDNPLEDMRSLGSKFTKSNGEPLSGPDRKRLMSDQKNRANLYYDKENVWTFHFWQHLLDLSTFKLDMSLRQFSLSGHLDGQPLQLMAKSRAGEYLWNFDVWHQSLIPDKPSANGEN
ncbi:hypothetical protein BSKO_00069 [Bryopsis sp. KO-2023]|nr:hypothetical protein BSKO_00069 [Bryopsis sp. KO-2023]